MRESKRRYLKLFTSSFKVAAWSPFLEHPRAVTVVDLAPDGAFSDDSIQSTVYPCTGGYDLSSILLSSPFPTFLYTISSSNVLSCWFSGFVLFFFLRWGLPYWLGNLELIILLPWPPIAEITVLHYAWLYFSGAVAIATVCRKLRLYCPGALR